jgi:hypothetical protein
VLLVALVAEEWCVPTQSTLQTTRVLLVALVAEEWCVPNQTTLQTTRVLLVAPVAEEWCVPTLAQIWAQPARAEVAATRVEHRYIQPFPLYARVHCV